MAGGGLELQLPLLRPKGGSVIGATTQAGPLEDVQRRRLCTGGDCHLMHVAVLQVGAVLERDRQHQQDRKSKAGTSLPCLAVDLVMGCDSAGS